MQELFARVADLALMPRVLRKPTAARRFLMNPLGGRTTHDLGLRMLFG